MESKGRMNTERKYDRKFAIWPVKCSDTNKWKFGWYYASYENFYVENITEEEFAVRKLSGKFIMCMNDSWYPVKCKRKFAILPVTCVDSEKKVMFDFYYLIYTLTEEPAYGDFVEKEIENITVVEYMIRKLAGKL